MNFLNQAQSPLNNTQPDLSNCVFDELFLVLQREFWVGVVDLSTDHLHRYFLQIGAL